MNYARRKNLTARVDALTGRAFGRPNYSAADPLNDNAQNQQSTQKKTARRVKLSLSKGGKALAVEGQTTVSDQNGEIDVISVRVLLSLIIPG